MFGKCMASVLANASGGLQEDEPGKENDFFFQGHLVSFVLSCLTCLVCLVCLVCLEVYTNNINQ